MADGTRSCCGTSWLDDCVCPPEREETDLPEAIRRIGEGNFYVDYDYASGPGLRILREATAAMEEFCDRVERGEVRSKRTYARFCKILARSPQVR